MLTATARLIIARPRTVIVAWIIAAAAMAGTAVVGIGGENIFDRMATGTPRVENTDSAFVASVLEQRQDSTVGPTLTMSLIDFDHTDPVHTQAASAALARWSARDDVVSVLSPFYSYSSTPLSSAAPPATADLISSAGSGVVIAVTFRADNGSGSAAGVHRGLVAELRDALATHDITVTGFSSPLLYDDFSSLMKKDLITGELVALPLALMVMVLIFGGFLAASTPMIGACASIAGGLAVLYAFSYPIALDDSSLNVVLVLAIGLSVDYGLLIVSRMREEITKNGHSVDDAVHFTVTSAGRTVLYSGLVVAIAAAGLLTFEAEILRGIGAAALGAVVMCMVSAITLVPAVAFVLGPRLVRPTRLHRWRPLRAVLDATADVKRDEGAFSTLAARVQRRPWLWLASSAVFLGILASPALGIHLRNSGVELLPADNDGRVLLEVLNDEYPALRDAGATILVRADRDVVETWARTEVSAVDGVSAIREIDVVDGVTLVSVLFDARDGGNAEASRVVRDIRGLDAPGSMWVGGQAANQIDFQESLARGAPVALGVVVAATLVLLFLMTGSVLVPIKTLLINALSLAATIGVVTWVFQGGHLDHLLGFTSTGGVESYVLVLILAFGFGLAMDYGLFLLSRIKELHDQGAPNDLAVRRGLQRSGRIITGAAAVIILVFLGFAAGDVLVIKQVGFGLACAVFLDATIVRMVLVPATMTLLGKYNWWAPRPLRALHRHFALRH